MKVVAGYPLVGRGRGLHLLNALQSLGPLVHVSLAEMWDGVVPKLCQHLEGCHFADYGLLACDLHVSKALI